MNKLQNLETDTNIFVSLNPFKKPKKEKIFKVINYEHPYYNFETLTNIKKSITFRAEKIFGFVVLI